MALLIFERPPMINSKDIRTRDAGAAMDLLCPRCGADNLHHFGVTFFERAEDAAELVRLTHFPPSLKTEVVRSDVSGNPSSRRDGLAVRFYCEQCGGETEDDVIELTIAQHKGSTEIGWRFTPRVPRP
ncbi:hypothetical protein [Phenylobacterium sp.]|uniref:hypothetical protein n=1 Tax=Phenylobacterium sp. TaxID=1871053 RepID=UPI003BAAE155